MFFMLMRAETCQNTW